jgi:hypothetical protein
MAAATAVCLSDRCSNRFDCMLLPLLTDRRTNGDRCTLRASHLSYARLSYTSGLILYAVPNTP